MNTKSILLFGFFTIVATTMLAEESTSASMPTMQPAIPLFSKPVLTDTITKKFPEETIPLLVTFWLQSQQAQEILQACSGRQWQQVGHDEQRKEIYTGQAVSPQAIVLTFSGKSSLEETITGLHSTGLAHNFIIDLDGKIYPTCNVNETVQEALQHRPYAVGVSGHVKNGHLDQRDMNSLSITISIVGTGQEYCTLAQAKSLAELISYLEKEYQIRPDQVLDYGCIACFNDASYGRRETNPNLPWLVLTQLGFATYPIPAQIENMQINPDMPTEAKISWTCLALRKLGFICPITNNAQNPFFQKALIAFQKHVKADVQDGTITDTTMKMLTSVMLQHEYFNPALKEILPILS